MKKERRHEELKQAIDDRIKKSGVALFQIVDPKAVASDFVTKNAANALMAIAIDQVYHKHKSSAPGALGFIKEEMKTVFAELLRTRADDVDRIYFGHRGAPRNGLGRKFAPNTSPDAVRA
jgi:hypothetical protein